MQMRCLGRDELGRMKLPLAALSPSKKGKAVVEVSVWYDFGLGVATGLAYSLSCVGALLLAGLIWAKAASMIAGLGSAKAALFKTVPVHKSVYIGAVAAGDPCRLGDITAAER